MNRNIQLRRLLLRDFKRHQSLEVEFSPTLTVIKGPNYSGKSSLLEALFFALFGLTAVPGNKQSVPRRGVKNCAVTLDLCADGRNVVIERSLTTAKVLVDDELRATSHSAVNSWVEDLIGMKQKAVLMLAYSSQGETQALLTLGASELNRVIEEVGNVRYVDELIERCGRRIADAEKLLASLPPRDDVEGCKTAIKTAEVQLEKKTEEAYTFDSAVPALAEAFTAASFALDSALTHNETAEKHNNRRVKVEAKLHYAEKHWMEMDNEFRLHSAACLGLDLAPLEAALEDATNAVVASYKKAVDRNHLKAELGGVESFLTGTAVSYREGAKLVKHCEDLFAAYDAAKTREEELRARVNETSGEVTARKAALAAIRQDRANAVCSACKRPFDAEHADHVLQQERTAEAELARLEAIGRGLAAECGEAQRLAARAEQEVKDCSKKLPPLDWEAQIAQREAERDRLQAELAALGEPESAEALGAVKDAAETALRTAKLKLSQLARCRAERDNLAAQRAELETELRVLQEVPIVEIAPLMDAKQKAQEALWQAREALRARQTEVGQIERGLEELRATLKRGEAANAARDRHEQRLARFGSFQKWLRQNKATFLRETWDQLLAITSEFAAACTSNAIEQVGRDESGGFWFVEAGEQMPVHGCASGAQKSVMGVGLRLALASLLPAGCNFLVLDEPSAELNDEHAAALAGALGTQGRQVVLVTHREGEEYLSDRMIVLQ